MRKIFKNKRVLKNCHIYQMLRVGAKRPHLSFHTPGHKQKGFDITELSYSDNLSCPSGCIAQAERDIIKLLRSEKSFILTDGSTSGVLSILHAAKTLGARSICFSKNSHKSVFNGCALLSLTPLLFEEKTEQNIPLPITMYRLNEDFYRVFEKSDALFLTYPDYYGNLADLKALKQLCKEKGKLLLIDGAHGSHLHFNKDVYAGEYADLWVDGAHKNLPTLTQGAVVSAKNKKAAEALRTAVDIFRTTSPSYPVMASVEYGIKYPENKILQREAIHFEKSFSRVYFGGDWTKLCVKFGKNAFATEKELQKRGIYPEFCDGNVILFYLSPATSLRHLKKLQKTLLSLFKLFPLDESNAEISNVQPLIPKEIGEQQATEWVALSASLNRVCAANCGLFPPCTPLIKEGELITKEKILLLQEADNVFGLHDGNICVYIN